VGIDAADQAYPLLSNVFHRMYIGMLKRAPFIWDYLYDNPDVELATRDARKLLTLISSFRTKKILKKYRPVAFVCTQAAPAIWISSEKKKNRLKVPLICVVTDFSAHSYWDHPEVDLYLVAHEDTKQELVRRGISSDRIRVSGIPIHPSFGETQDPLEARRRLHIHPHKPTLLLMGGSHGMGPIDDLIEGLKTIPVSFQTIVVCGKNRPLYKKCLRIASDSADFYIYSYVKDTALLMSASDIIISKPGGLTCAEALAKQIPMIVTSPLPGQEEKNVRFLTKHRVARVARTQEDLIHAVLDLIKHPRKRDELKQRAKLISHPHSAWESAHLIFDLINHRGSFAKHRIL
jgi:processive 1,2-diacylglycerol beta-glucosyltransferase